MLSGRSVAALLLTVATAALLVSPTTTNGHINPYFACTANSYTVSPSEDDEITLNNCSASDANEIIRHLRQSRLRERPLRLNTLFTSNLITTTTTTTTISDDLLAAAAAIHLDLSDGGLSELDLGSAPLSLKRLNLTANKFRSLSSIRLRDNITLYSVDVSYNRLSALASNAIPSTARLFLRSNTIVELEANLTLPDALLELDLTRNEIENIILVAFSSSRLTTLNLSVNLINAVATETFVGLPALQILLLECNKIARIEADAFAGNGKLAELSLRDNNIFTLKKGVFDNLTSLKVLDVSENRLLRLSADDVRELNNLVRLSVSANTKLCQQGGSSSRCTRERDLTRLLLTLGGRLRALKASGLGMRTFPVALTTFVRTLDLSANKLTRIQAGDLESFPFLRVLDLSDNVVDAAEEDVFSRLEYLRELYLQDNRLERVPGSLPPSLAVLRLDGNRIRVVASNDLNSLSRLSVLRLDSNAIVSIESDAFAALSSLSFLDVSRNPMRRLRMDTFAGANTLNTLHATDLVAAGVNATGPRYFPTSRLAALRHLNLSRSAQLARCFLRDYPLLATVKQLEVLDLDHTNLTRASLSHLQRQPFFPRLRLLSLRGNRINCSGISFDQWREPYRLETETETETPYRINDLVHRTTTELTVRVSRHFTRPFCDRVTIRSGCASSMATANCSVVSKEDFWSSQQWTTTVLRESSPRVIARKFGTVRSTLTDEGTEVVTNATYGDHDIATILLPTTRHPVKGAAAPHHQPFPDTPVPFSIHSAGKVTINDGRTSFFDWFPSSFNNNNSTAVEPARVIISAEGGDDDQGLENITHLGLFIFLFVCTLVLVTFGSLIVPTCVQKRANRWRRPQRRRVSPHSGGQQNLPYMEISSISTSFIVDGEINSD